MKFIAYLAGGSILTAMVLNAVSVLTGLAVGKEIWFGMLGPMLASVITWVAIERQKITNPQKMLKCIIQGFVIKSFFFGAYIVVLVQTNQVRPGLFICLFAFFYLALHMTEALELRRVQARLVMNGINRATCESAKIKTCD